MAIAIDNTKFIGLLNVEVTSDTEYLDAVSAQIIADMLPRWFGYALAKAIQSVTPSADVQKLIDGVEYTDDSGNLQKLTGLNEYLLYFVYFYYVRDKITFDSNLGSQEALAENAKASNPTSKLVQNYNKGVKSCNEMIGYISDNSTLYPTADLIAYLDNINSFGI